MHLLSRSQTCVGVDLGSSVVKIVQLERRGERYRVRRFGCRGLDPDVVDGVPDHNSPRLKATLSDLIRELDVFGSPVVMSVSGPSVMVKRIRLSGVKPDSLDEYLTWEGHQYIPYAMQDIYFDYWILPPSRHGAASTDIELLLVAAKHQVVENRKRLLEEVGVRPVVCDVDGLALLKVVMEKSRTFRGQSFGIVNVGASGLNVAFVGQDDPLLVRDVSFEEISPVQADDAPASSVADDAMHDAPRSGTTDTGTPPGWGDVVSAVQYCLESVLERYPELSMEKIFLCGGQSKHEQLHHALQHALSVPTIALNPFDEIECLAHGEAEDPVPELAHLGGVALGLALHQDCHGEH